MALEQHTIDDLLPADEAEELPDAALRILESIWAVVQAQGGERLIHNVRDILTGAPGWRPRASEVQWLRGQIVEQRNRIERAENEVERLRSDLAWMHRQGGGRP